MILLHEGIVDSRIWARVLPLLAERHRVIRYDQRGYGRSPLPDGPYSVVEDFFAVLDAAEVGEAVVVGASRGGDIALGAPLERPDPVPEPVLVGTGLPGYSR